MGEIITLDKYSKARTMLSASIITQYHTALLGNFVIPFLDTSLVFPAIVQPSIDYFVRKHIRFNFNTEGSMMFIRNICSFFF